MLNRIFGKLKSKNETNESEQKNTSSDTDPVRRRSDRSDAAARCVLETAIPRQSFPTLVARKDPDPQRLQHYVLTDNSEPSIRVDPHPLPKRTPAPHPTRLIETQGELPQAKPRQSLTQLVLTRIQEPQRGRQPLPTDNRKPSIMVDANPLPKRMPASCLVETRRQLGQLKINHDNSNIQLHPVDPPAINVGIALLDANDADDVHGGAVDLDKGENRVNGDFKAERGRMQGGRRGRGRNTGRRGGNTGRTHGDRNRIRTEQDEDGIQEDAYSQVENNRGRAYHRRGNNRARGGRRYHSEDRNGKGAARNRTQERERSVDILDWRRLTYYSKQDPSTILVSLGHDYSGLQDCLNTPPLYPNFVKLLLSVLAKACSCDSTPQNLNNILAKLPGSLFLTSGLPRVILGLQSENNPREIVTNILRILKELLIRIPDSYADQTGVLTNLQTELDYIRGDGRSDAIDDELLAFMNDVVDLQREKHRFMRERQIRKQMPRRYDNLRGEAEGHPPDDYREIQIIPTQEDLNSDVQPFVRKNKVKGKYDDVDHYLDVQFRLLREDFIYPLRKGISEYLQITPGLKTSKYRLQDVRVYTDVSIIRCVCSRTDLFYRIQFDVTPFKRVKWAISKRLIYGSLVCLSSDGFQTYFVATVADRDAKLLADGYIHIDFQHDLMEINAVPPDQKFVMVETTAYFEAYKHVLRGLQTIRDLPFEKYIVQCENQVDPPRYLRQNIGNIFDLRPLVDDDVKLREDLQLRGQRRTDVYDFSRRSVVAEKVNIMELRLWPSHLLLGVNKSQYKALQTALTKEFSIIQGPPGTGKTYLGLKIVKALLHNSKTWDPQDANRRPMLIVCYTNHALDQFLVGITKFYKGPVLRVGGRISDPCLEDYSLRAKKKKSREERRFKDLSRLSFIHGDKIRHLHQEIEYSAQRIDAADTEILTANTLQHVMNRMHREQFETDVSPVIPQWLGLKKSSTFVKSMLNDTNNDQIEDLEGEEMIEVEGDSDILRNNRVLLEDTDDINDKDFESVVREGTRIKRMCIAFDVSNLEKSLMDNDGFHLPREQIKKFKRKLRDEIKCKNKMTEMEAGAVNNVWIIGIRDRWRLYRYWTSKFRDQLRLAMTDKCAEYKQACAAQREVNLEKERRIMQESTVIAMTTTGAARYRGILQEVNPRIIVVEEAAEVLEGHIITALARDCQQLILIGDHKQLRPNPNVYKLATNFNLEVSLFERMIQNKVHWDCLELQHRMRPEISKLMKLIYKELKDHESVEHMENVKGLQNNIFFINHSHFETHDEESKSHSNLYEARYVVALTDYLLKQGYTRDKLTVLTTYSGQMFQLRKLMPKSKYEGIRVTPVDNYQGEENDIIILSLVRSNTDNKAGFLKIDNRICVALSRAKKGLYVIGNFDMLQSQSPLWKEICIMLRRSGELGETLVLKCQNHPEDSGIEIYKPEDFLKAPAGGCQKLCEARLDCGHACVMSCHPTDLEHKEYRCYKPCPKTCPQNHPCRLKCYQDCGKCDRLVTKKIPMCGHEDQVPCYMEPEKHKCTHPCKKILPCGHKCANLCGFSHKCLTMVSKTWPCGHTGKIPCPQKETAKCTSACNKTLACGHQCQGTCAGCFSGRLHQTCKKKCTKILVCNHQCESFCSECPPCKRKCENRCPHSKCAKRCGELCKPCQEPCTWKCEHYQCSKKCSEPCDRPPCNVACTKILRCGHKCIGLCGEPCPRYCRECDKDVVTEIFFGTEDEPDARFVELNDCKHIVEYKSMDAWMNQDTSTDSTQAVGMKTCPKCKAGIRRSVRYGSITNRLLETVHQVKQNYIGNRTRIQQLREEIVGEVKVTAATYGKSGFPFMVDCGTNRSLRVQATEKLKTDAGNCTSENELIALKNQLRFLLKATETYKKFYERAEDKTGRGEKRKRYISIVRGVQDFIDWICRERSSLSEQEIQDAQNELERQSVMYQLFLHELEIEVKGLDIPPSLQSRVTESRQLLDTGVLLTKDDLGYLKSTIELLKKVAPSTGLGISDQERVMVVEAMGLSKGHWYKCKNGHIYAIGDCGGATVEGTCPECNQGIGGSSHRLRDDNAVATEMDGARYSAWSEQANLGNYEGLDML